MGGERSHHFVIPAPPSSLLSANFVGNTLTQSEAIEIYTPYDVTSPRPRKRQLHFLPTLEGLFWAPDQSLN